ncbi:MAG: DUF928 domain-containing protein [Cyanobacteria bacterium P01_G01_bin.54]
MNLSKILPKIPAYLVGLTASGLVSLPFSGQAIEYPTPQTTESAPHRSAAASPKRCVHTCITESYDFNNNGQLDRDERVTPVTVIAPEGNVTTTSSHTVHLVIYMPELRAESAELFVDQRVPVPGSDHEFRYQEIYYNDAVALPRELQAGPRLVTLTLTDLPLQPGETYVWSLSFSCGESDWASIYSTVEGLITATEEDGTPPDASGLNQTTLARIAQDYADRQLWSETLQLTAQLRPAHPEEWSELLESQGLGCFKDVPFAGETADFTIDDDPRCFVN